LRFVFFAAAFFFRFAFAMMFLLVDFFEFPLTALEKSPRSSLLESVAPAKPESSR
jgi:hypothetical protein